MIYGIVPVGGLGTRLGLPFPKEMIPLKGYDYFYPVCKLTVDNMLSAGCTKIYFIHGQYYKPEIVKYFDGNIYSHVNNRSPRQSEVFSSFYNSIEPQKNDIFYYGLPDTYYKDNLFNKLKEKDGLVCGMYKVDDNAKVGRVNLKTNKFEKSIKQQNLTDFCWGVLKFDYFTLQNFNDAIIKNCNFESEDLLNIQDFQLVYGDYYYDLGTWECLNKYWNS